MLFEPLVNEVREALFRWGHVMSMSSGIREPADAGTTGVFPGRNSLAPTPSGLAKYLASSEGIYD